LPEQFVVVPGGLFQRPNIRHQPFDAPMSLIAILYQKQRREAPVEMIFWGYRGLPLNVSWRCKCPGGI